MLLSFCLIFCQFQDGVVDRSVAYEKKRVLNWGSIYWLLSSKASVFKRNSTKLRKLPCQGKQMKTAAIKKRKYYHFAASYQKRHNGMHILLPIIKQSMLDWTVIDSLGRISSINLLENSRLKIILHSKYLGAKKVTDLIKYFSKNIESVTVIQYLIFIRCLYL